MTPYVHHVPGRLRVRVPKVKGNSAEASLLERRIRAQRGVKNVQTSPLTGSVLVHYDPATASVSTLSQIMLCSAATEPMSRTLPAAPHTGTNQRIGQQIAARVATAVVGHFMEMAVERAAVALIAALL
jgi:Heavy metal associated domain 2